MTTDHDSTPVGHTPPPWHYYLDSEGYYVIGHSSEAHEPGAIAHVYIPGSTDPEYDDHNEGLANARLMTSAPAMLEALKANVKHEGILNELRNVRGAGGIDIARRAEQSAREFARLRDAALAAAQAPEGTA